MSNSQQQPKSDVLLILLDAFSQVYFSTEYAPFLGTLAENGIIDTLDPLFAYRGMETTMFTGVWPSVHKVWTEFKFKGEMKCDLKDRFLQQITKIVDTLPNDGLRTKTRFLVERYLFKRYYSALNLIPSNALPYFVTSQKKETEESGSTGEITTLFDIFRKMRIQYTVIKPWIWGDRGVFINAMKKINQGCKSNFWYLKFSCLDHMGHRFGPEPVKFKNELIKIDRYIEQIVTRLKKKKHNLQVLILADHGMSRVSNAIDILGGLSHLRSRLYKDYLVFADSTMLRFWFFTEQASHEIWNLLQQIQCGHVLSTREKETLRIPLDREYGEEIFVVDEGCLLHPSFFAWKSKVKGMHGYAYPKTPEARPIVIMNEEMAADYPANRKIDYIDIPYLVVHSLFPNLDRLNYIT